LEDVKNLLDRGASINGKLGILEKRALHMAAEHGEAEVVEELLNAKGVGVNAIDRAGRTALHEVAENGTRKW
jgi:ankyrin repeat protein